MSSRRNTKKTIGYWAVFKGRSRGVYTSLGDCMAQVSDLSDGSQGVWRRFPKTPEGLEDAKAFCTHGPTESSESSASSSETESEPDSESSSSSSDDDSDILYIRLETNWDRKRQLEKKSRPQYAVIFDHEMEDPRNIFSWFDLPNPTMERCIQMALLTFLQWTKDPLSAKKRRKHDPIA